jgi:hypothetical protein
MPVTGEVVMKGREKRFIMQYGHMQEEAKWAFQPIFGVQI